MTPTASSWSISVKTVGGSDSVKAAKASSIQLGNSSSLCLDRDNSQSSVNPDSASLKDPPVSLKSHHGTNSATASMQSMEEVPPNFTVKVESSDKLSMLHKKIEEVTGLQASQQRLIYRGRLITKQPTTSSKDDDLIRDIEGLCDGQTIHLVPRPLPENDKSNVNGNRNNGGGESGSSSRPRSNSMSSNSTTGNSASAATSLIATLLGLSMPSSVGASNNGNSNNNNNNNNNTNEEEDLDILTSRAHQSSNSTSTRERRRQMFSISNTSNTSSSSRRSNSSANNLSSSRRGGRSSVNAQNVGIWEGNPIEPLRQGLMTLHTLLESHPSNNNNVDNNDEDDNTCSKSNQEDTEVEEEVMERKMSYLEAARNKKDNSRPRENTQTNQQKARSYTPLPPKWYLGQWLDVKDTVDQWLEATIDKVVYYTDIFTPDQIEEYGTNATLAFSADDKENIRKHNLKVDPIVGAGDQQGCKALFLEEMPNHLDEAGFPLMKFRDNYKETQLILVHYNSWPHRWDEWIRGDSKRISMFRTKTRHPPSAPFASPTPNSHYFEAPTTHIYQDGDHDRAAILPELCRAMNHVQLLLNAAIPTSSDTVANTITTAYSPSVTTHTSSGDCNVDLPWVRIPPPASDNNDFSQNEGSQEENLQQDLKEDSDVTSPDLSPSLSSPPSTVSTMLQGLSREQLGSLAPILDRLGRTLTDAAPHIAELSSSLPSKMEMERKKHQHEDQQPASDSEAPAKAEIYESTEQASNARVFDLNVNTNNNQADATNPVLEEENERPQNDLSSTIAGPTNTSNSPTSQQPNPNPHHPHADRYQRRSFAQLQSENNEPLDYSLSLVNTSRDENPTRRSRHSASSSTNQDPNSSFLGTYLAARGIAEEDRDAGSTLARLLRAGSGGISGGDSNGGNNNGSGGGGIDIHIHAIVTPVGAGGGMDVGIGLPDMGAFPFVGLQSVTQDSNPASDTEGSLNAGEINIEGNNPILNNLTVPDLNEDLFSDLYTESPTPFQFAVNEFGEELGRVEENESSVIGRNNTTSEESFPLTAYSMVVGDIPILPSDNQIISNIENTVVASDTIEEELPNAILPTANLEVSATTRLPSQAQSIMPATSTNMQGQTSQSTSQDNPNPRGRRRTGSALGRFARAFRRSSSSRGQGSSRR